MRVGRIKKGDPQDVLKNRPINSALSVATQNIHYAELGITAIFTAKLLAVPEKLEAFLSFAFGQIRGDSSQ